jgi:hypothetical protein
VLTRLGWRFAEADGAAEATTELVAACARVAVLEQAAVASAATLRNLEASRFCKSHAATVARVAWRQCLPCVACLAAFWNACLNHHDGRFASWAYVECAKGDGVVALAPCVNPSASLWTQEVTPLRAGLSGVRAVGRRRHGGACGAAEGGAVRFLRRGKKAGAGATRPGRAGKGRRVRLRGKGQEP